MTELQGHDGHDSYAYVQLRAAQRDLVDAHRRIRELESQLEEWKRLCRQNEIRADVGERKLEELTGGAR